MFALAFGAFLLFGVMLVLVGANQAELARDLGLDLSGSGLLVSLLSLGLGAGVLGAGPLVDRWPRRPLFVAASLVAAAALVPIDPSMTAARAGLHLAVVGAGLGVYETLLNTVVGELHGARAAKPLTFVHAGATLGAMLGPGLAVWIAGLADWSWSFRALGAGHLLLAAAAFAVRFPPPSGSDPAAGPFRLPPGATRALLPFGVIAFAYVGVEGALCVLAVPYATQTLGLPQAHGVAAISAFWMGLLGGRLALLLARGALDARYLVVAGVAAALVLGAGVAARLGPIELLFGATGAALGVVFPLMVALVGERAGRLRGTATGMVVGAGALGGFTLPWLHGALGDAGGPALAVGTLSAWAALVAWAARRSR